MNGARLLLVGLTLGCAARSAPWSSPGKEAARATLRANVLDLPALQRKVVLPSSWWKADRPSDVPPPQVLLDQEECRSVAAATAARNEPLLSTIDEVIPLHLCVAHASWLPLDLPTSPWFVRIYLDRHADSKAVGRYLRSALPDRLRKHATDLEVSVKDGGNPLSFQMLLTYRDVDVMSSDRVEVDLQPVTGGGTLMVMGVSDVHEAEFGFIRR